MVAEFGGRWSSECHELMRIVRGVPLQRYGLLHGLAARIATRRFPQNGIYTATAFSSFYLLFVIVRICSRKDISLAPGNMYKYGVVWGTIVLDDNTVGGNGWCGGVVVWWWGS